jgi:large subunit ribosomal protein L18
MSDINRKRREALTKRKRRVRKKVVGLPERPRLTVFRSHRYIYAQIIDDMGTTGPQRQGSCTLLAASSRKIGAREVPEGLSGKCAVAYCVGRELAERAKEKGIEKVVFDRSGYLYHGRVAALARGCREGGIAF